MGFNSIFTKLVGPVYRPFRHESARLAQKYTRYYKKKSVLPNTILYEVRDGQSITDSPKAIFEYLLSHDVEKKYTHIWTVVPSPELEVIQGRYAHHDNVQFVTRNSDAYLAWLAQAAYLINNATFQPFFIAKQEQTYINTWHGTPLKVMGYDMPGNPNAARNVVRNLHQMDYFLSPNAHTSDVFLNSYRLKGGISGTILEGGYPRIDQTLLVNPTALKELLASLAFHYDTTKKIVLYAPTWKGTAIGNSRNDVAQIQGELEYLRAQHGEEYNILVKVHPFLYKTAQTAAGLRPYLIPDVVDTNELLGVVDVLVTDYSSIFFDFLVTRRPIIFYTWDEDIYEQERGNYFPIEELPGPSCPTMIDVATALSELDVVKEMYHDNYVDYVARFTPYEDGRVTERYVAEIFLKDTQPKITRYEPETTKEKIIFYPGGLINNGITTSFINLISNLDYERYDVTCLMGVDTTPAQYLNIQRLAPEVHLLYRFSDATYTKSEEYASNFFSLTGYVSALGRLYPQQAYQREMRRLLGRNKYDYAIDFSGYSLFWSKFVLAIPAKKHLVFLHSDMAADKEREVNGRKIHKLNLRGIFSVYQFYDYLVSVTSVISDVNKEKLSKYASADKFTYAANTLNPGEILAPPAQLPESTASIQKRGGMAHFNQREVTLWPTVPGRAESESVVAIVATKQKIRLLAEVVLAEHTYYKVCYGDIYFGWVASEVLTFTDSFEEPIKKKIALLGKVIKPEGTEFIYSAPLGLPGAKITSPASLIADLVVRVTCSIQTSHGLFYAVEAQGREFGWLRQDSLTLFNFYQKPYGKLLAHYLSGKDRLQHRRRFKQLDRRFTTYAEVSCFAKVSGPVTLETTPDFPLGRGQERALEGEVIGKIRRVGETQGKAYAYFTSEGLAGWLPQELALPLKPEEVAVYQQRRVDATATPTQEAIELGELVAYPSIEQLTETVTLPVTGETLFKLTEEVSTTDASVYWQSDGAEGENVWLKDETIEISETHGCYTSSGRFVHYPNAQDVNFVTLGRLSPEKDQLSLIEAFARYRTEAFKGNLYIIGEGPMRPLLTQRIAELAISEHVFLLGHIAQPFNFMRHCDYFVLTSKYEGQSLALLEALTLGLPVVSTDIPACRQVLGDGKYGLLTRTNDVAGIAKALADIQTEADSFAPFDSQAYNQAAIKEFEKLLN